MGTTVNPNGQDTRGKTPPSPGYLGGGCHPLLPLGHRNFLQDQGNSTGLLLQLPYQVSPAPAHLKVPPEYILGDIWPAIDQSGTSPVA